MEVKLAVSIWTLLLLTVESHPTARPASLVTVASPNTTDSPSTTTGPCLCPTTPPPQPRLVFFTVVWKKENPCEGTVSLRCLSSDNSVGDCDDHGMTLTAQKLADQTLLSRVCEEKKGCRGQPFWNNLKVRCSEVEECDAGEGYKVMTGLLVALVVVILVVRFGKPTLKTFQKRLSDRRQSRWVGPTQSQSVSYHRGKTGVQNNDTDKRLSYPALERLTINNSREPSSNRNSDFDCHF